MITGVVLARNEERNIVDCLTALRPHVSELLLIDMDSRDRTVQLAQPYVDHVLFHSYQANFDSARNIAITAAGNEWMWFVDADERIPMETGRLVNELVRTRGREFEALLIPFKNYFCGQWMRHCGWWPGYTMPRVLRKGCFRFSDTLHAGVEVNGRQMRIPPDAGLAVEHFSFRNVEHYVEKLNRYTSTEAGQIAPQGKRFQWQDAVSEMVRDLWIYYELNSGHLDGERGWILSWLSGQYRWLTNAKLIDLQSRSGGEQSFPASLDDVMAAMERQLAVLRTATPLIPVGVVWRSPIWDSSGYAEDSRASIRALALNDRPLRVEIGDAQDSPNLTEAAPVDAALFRALSRGRRSRSTLSVINMFPLAASPEPTATINVVRTVFETDRIPAAWARNVNAFDEVWAPSRYVARSFRRSGVPPERIRVIPQWIDTSVFAPSGPKFSLPEACRGRFVFLSLFDWHLRKGWDLLLAVYAQEFSVDDGAALLLKITRQRWCSPADVERQANAVMEKIGQRLIDRPDIIIWEQLLGGEELASLYRSADAFVLASRGEGWGRPLMEAMACGVPTIGTGASGNIDFMTKDNSLLVRADEVDVSDEAATEIPFFSGHRWYEPNADDLRTALRRMFHEPRLRRRLARRGKQDMHREFSIAAGSRVLEAAVADAEQRVVIPAIAAPHPHQVRVQLDGEIFAGHSFAKLNEIIGARLACDPTIAFSLRPVRYNDTLGTRSREANFLKAHIHRDLGGDPEVVIRHAFPPDWTPPAFGRWIHMQPFEFGSLPKEWIGPLRDQVDEVWACSNYVRRLYEKCGVASRKIRLIPNGVDASVYNPQAPPLHLSTEKAFRFLYVGGMIARKGFDILLAAYLAEFKPQDDVCLVVKDVGSQSVYRNNNFRSHVLQAVADLRNPAILYIEDFLSEGQMASLYTACHCLVAPYRGEGFGLPILEGMACGVPAVVPRGGPTDDFVSMDTGYLLPAQEVPCDHPWELCHPATELAVRLQDVRAAMREAFENRARCAELGRQASRAVSKRFDWSRIVQQMQRRIIALAKRGGARGTSVAGGPARQTVVGSRKPHTQARLSVCMIVRDSSTTLPAALASIKPWADELIVVDTGSIDDTPQIAQSFGARLFHFQWCDDFAAARNESLTHATGEWVFWMDSDDTIDAENGRRLRDLVDAAHPPGVFGYVAKVDCPGPEPDGQFDTTVVDHVKLFRNRPEIRFEGRIHEQVLGSIRRAGGDIAWTEIHVVHSGADHTPEGRRRKQERDLRILRQELAAQPDHPFVLFNLGMTYADCGEHQQAIEHLTRCLVLSPQGESHVRKAYALLAASHFQLDQIQPALQVCQEGRQLFPCDCELAFRAGMALHRLGRLSESVAAYRDCLAGDPERHFSSMDRGICGYKTRHNLALVYGDLGQHGEAEHEWRQALAEAPTYHHGWRGLGESLLAQRKLAEFSNLIVELGSHSELRAIAPYLEGRRAELDGKLAEARRFYERSNELAPSDREPLEGLCHLLFATGDDVAAEIALRRLAELSPQNAAVRHNLGSLYLRNGRFAEAATAFRDSLGRRPNSAATLLNLGHALSGLGFHDEASGVWRQVRRLSPDFEPPDGARPK